MSHKTPEPNYVILHLHRLESADGDILKRLERSVGQLSDKIAALNTAFDAALTRVSDDVNTLTAKVADLQAKVDAGGATTEDIAALDALKAKIDALDPTKPDVLPDEPVDPEVEEIPVP